MFRGKEGISLILLKIRLADNGPAQRPVMTGPRTAHWFAKTYSWPSCLDRAE